MIEFTKRRRDSAADLFAGDLSIELPVKIVFDLLNERDLRVFGDGPLATGRLDSAKDAFAVERNAGLIPLDHDEASGLFDAFESGESLFAVFAFPTAADRGAAFSRP